MNDNCGECADNLIREDVCIRNEKPRHNITDKGLTRMTILK